LKDYIRRYIMNLEQIGQLNLENSFLAILHRMVDFTVIDNGLVAYEISSDTSLSMFDRTTLNTQVVKPLLADMEAEFLVYKQELTDIETARLAEIARREALQVRIGALGNHFHQLLELANIANIPNAAAEYLRIINEDDTAVLGALEAVLPTHLANVAKKAERELLKQEGSRAKKCCDDCLDIVRGFNKGRSDAQIAEMKATFASIFVELNYASVSLAKNLINNLSPSADLIPLQIKLLEEFAEHGF